MTRKSIVQTPCRRWRHRVVEVADPYKSAYMRNLLFCYNLFNDPEYTVDDRLMGYIYHERVAPEEAQSL